MRESLSHSKFTCAQNALKSRRTRARKKAFVESLTAKVEALRKQRIALIDDNEVLEAASSKAMRVLRDLEKAEPAGPISGLTGNLLGVMSGGGFGSSMVPNRVSPMWKHRQVPMDHRMSYLAGVRDAMAQQQSRPKVHLPSPVLVSDLLHPPPMLAAASTPYGLQLVVTPDPISSRSSLVPFVEPSQPWVYALPSPFRGESVSEMGLVMAARCHADSEYAARFDPRSLRSARIGHSLHRS